VRIAAPIGRGRSIDTIRHSNVCLISLIKAPRRRYRSVTVIMQETRLDKPRYNSTSLSVIGIEARIDRVVRYIVSLNLFIPL